jgi:hypothetical protein
MIIVDWLAAVVLRISSRVGLVKQGPAALTNNKQKKCKPNTNTGGLVSDQA